MKNDSLIKKAFIATLCEHPDALKFQKEAFNNNNLSSVQDDLLQGGKSVTKSDFFTLTDGGEHFLSFAGAWNNFDKISKIILDNGENFTIKDFTTPLANGKTLLKFAEEHDALDKLFTAKIWNNNYTEMEELWFQVTPFIRRSYNEGDGILSVKREIYNETGKDLREDKLKEIGIDYKDFPNAFEKKDRFNELLSTLELKGEKLTKEDVMMIDDGGSTMFWAEGAWDNFKNIVDLLEKNNESLSVDDFLYRLGNSKNILERAAEFESLPEVFEPKLWVNRVDDMVDLWSHVKLVPQAQLKNRPIDDCIAAAEDMTYGHLVSIDETVNKLDLLSPLNAGDTQGKKIIPLGLISVWKKMDTILPDLESNDESVSLADLREISGYAESTCLMSAVKSGYFDTVLKILDKNKEKLDVEDFTRQDALGASMLNALIRRGDLEKAFNASIWVGRSDEMQKLWQMVPYEAKSTVDFDEILNKVNIASVNHLSKGTKLKRRPPNRG